jgi:hypothetical protein
VCSLTFHHEDHEATRRVSDARGAAQIALATKELREHKERIFSALCALSRPDQFRLSSATPLSPNPSAKCQRAGAEAPHIVTLPRKNGNASEIISTG